MAAGRRERCRADVAAAGRAAHGDAAVAERVCLVEEDDHAAVPQRQLAQLAEQPLDLQHAHAEEHVDERARVDEHVRLAGLAGDRLRHQRLPGSWRPPQQDAAGHVAAPVLDELRVLQEDDVLLHPVQDVVLTPDVGEPGLDVVRVVDVHPAPGQEPEQQPELGDGEEQQEGVLDEGRQRVPQDRRDLRQRGERRVVHDLAGDDGDDNDNQHPAENPPEPVSRPRRQLGGRQPLRPAPDFVNPELVVGRPVLADQEVDLVEQLEAEQDEDPRAQLGLDPDGIEEPDERIVRHERPDEQQPDHNQQDQPLHPVPERQPLPGQDVFFPGAAALVGESIHH